MQAYNASFARIYNLRWANFPRNAAPKLQAYYESTALGRENHNLLDVCCGTGQLALHFLDNGYHVTGLDLSAAMLDYARASATAYIVTGQAGFLQADASSFELEDRFGLVVSTYDALNHLPDMAALKGCFRSVFAVLEKGGTFIFDLNTTEGLRRWAGISVEDTPELMLITRALYDEEMRRAYMRISGFTLTADGLYERFEETAYEVPFALEEVRAALIETGFRAVRFARLQDLTQPVEEPERDTRIFIVAEK